MSSTKHDKDGNPVLDRDLERNPGIGQSKGAFATGESPEELEGENTTEGDVDNDSNPDGRSAAASKGPDQPLDS